MKQKVLGISGLLAVGLSLAHCNMKQYDNTPAVNKEEAERANSQNPSATLNADGTLPEAAATPAPEATPAATPAPEAAQPEAPKAAE